MKRRSIKYHVETQEKIKERSTNFMLKRKRRSGSVASSTMLNCKKNQVAKHQVHVELQEKIKQRSIKYHVERQEKIIPC